MTLRRLPEGLVNRIAAGEVIERPANALKEIVENAVDAGATRIDVALANGGKTLILVVDDGSGMAPDELALAVERHVTSKLPGDDLGDIRALGFRGEALPSIASVSRMLLETKPAGDEEATVIEINGGKMIDVRDQALPPGTTITVRNLFYNVPARRKFLRTEKTELAHIIQLVT
ncbi:MAG: DNA mismatch repair endonuclease MutL, partial [Alphaproteobacteria bacterium]